MTPKKVLIVVENNIGAKLTHSDNNQMYVLSVDKGHLDKIKVFLIDKDTKVEIKEEESK